MAERDPKSDDLITASIREKEATIKYYESKSKTAWSLAALGLGTLLIGLADILTTLVKIIK